MARCAIHRDCLDHKSTINTANQFWLAEACRPTEVPVSFMSQAPAQASCWAQGLQPEVTDKLAVEHLPASIASWGSPPDRHRLDRGGILAADRPPWDEVAEPVELPASRGKCAFTSARQPPAGIAEARGRICATPRRNASGQRNRAMPNGTVHFCPAVPGWGIRLVALHMGSPAGAL